MPRSWRRREAHWYPAFLPWIGVETWHPEDAMHVLGLPVRRRYRVLSVEWLWHGFTIAAWEAPDA